jgi:hypothetical protein
MRKRARETLVLRGGDYGNTDWLMLLHLHRRHQLRPQAFKRALRHLAEKSAIRTNDSQASE